MPYHHGNLREALLERAAQVIAADGVEALTLRGLARDLGVSHAAPQRHFADRAAVLAELAKEGIRRSIDAMEQGAEAAGSDPVARYRALGRSYVQFAMEHPSYFRAINHPEVQQSGDEDLARARRAWIETLRDGVDIARADGWHPEQDSTTLMAFSCAAAMGAATMLSDPSWRDILGTDDVDTLADKVLDLVVHRSLPPLREAALPKSSKSSRQRTDAGSPAPRKRRSA